MLLAAFERVVRLGASEVVLVSGYPGVGKSTLVNELHKVIVRPRGLFAAGKFDRYRREVPYDTLAQVFGELVRQILSMSESDVGLWRDEIRDAVGTSGRLVVDVVPELEHLIGEQPSVPELPPREAQNRLHEVFRRFAGVFASAEHPLVLFLDDLQWLDAASLELLQHLVTHPDVRHLLLIGAYRDTEVGPSHPLSSGLDAIRRTDAVVRELDLQPLGRREVELLVAETLRSPVARAEPLAALVHDKTGGNPFFAIQFLTALAEEGLLDLDRRVGTWTWDVDRIREKGFTDNVVDLVVAKLNRLPEPTRRTLELLACLGNRGDASTLTLIRGGTDEGTHEALWDAVHAGLVLRIGDTYAFAHDRVQEAAYALIPARRRPAEHARIGRLLMAHKTTEEIEASPFEIVNQLNRGDLIEGPDERAELCRLNFLAGCEAKVAGAYAPAHAYLAQAESLLPPDAWDTRYDDTFALYLELSECEYLVGRFGRADDIFNLILEAARSDRDRARAYILRVKLYQLSGRYDEGMSVSLEALRLFGVTLPEHDPELDEAFADEVRAIDAAMRGRPIADLVDAPLATDPDARTVISLLAESIPCSYIARPRLFPIVAAKGMNVCLQHGVTPDSCRIYLNYGALLVTSGEIARGAEFSETALRLNDRFDDPTLRGKLLHSHGAYVNHWRRHLATSRPLQEQAFAACVETGDLVFAGYAAILTMLTWLESGEPLDDVLEACRAYLAFARQSRNDVVFQFLRTMEQFVASLRGTTRGPGSLDDETFDSAACVAYLAKAGFGAGVGTTHTLRHVSTYTYGRFADALEAARETEPWLSMIAGSMHEATHHFFYALTLAAVYPDATPAEQQQFRLALAEKLAKLKHWADNCPENFAHRYALVAAEVARIEGRDVDAMRLYDDAIRSARENGFLQHEALCFELGARFFQAHGMPTAADTYLREAHVCYARWGADGKARQLEELYPQLRSQESVAAPSVFHGGLEGLDTLAVTKASQAISSEIVLEQLLDTLMKIVLESAGADRGVMLVPEDDRLSLVAEATAHDDDVTVRVEARRWRSETTLPQSILDYVRRSRNQVLLDDAREENPFSGDPYLAREQAKSVLCLAVVRHGELVGVLYLENTLASHAFTPGRLQVIELLAAQAAISLENARLYAELERLFTLSRDAIVTAGFDGALRHVNPAFAELLGYSADELVAHRLVDFVDVEDRDRTAAELERVLAGAASIAFENRTVGKDGTVRWLEWTAIAEPERELLYAIARNVTERKLVEAEHDRLEMELRQAQKMEAVGRLAGGVAHDFNNLLTAISGYSEFLFDALPEGRLRADAEEIRRAAERAEAVTRQLLAFSRRQLAQSVIIDLNEVVTDMSKLLRRLIGADVELVTLLAPDLERVEGDRSQFEQVIVNLALNARDAMPRGGKLVIETANAAADARLPRGDYVRISVTDTGAGMDEETRSHIFEPFFTTKGVGRGTGLGLATVFGIVEGCGGRIFVDSDLGAGTTFEIYLPQSEQPVPRTEPPGRSRARRRDRRPSSSSTTRRSSARWPRARCASSDTACSKPGTAPRPSSSGASTAARWTSSSPTS